MEMSKIAGALEAILFAMAEPLHIKQLSDAVETDAETTRRVLRFMNDEYAAQSRGIRIREAADTYQLCTSAEYFIYINNMAKLPQRRALTQSALETLAIVAYKQPVTKSDIEKIRGVDASHAVNKLVEYELVAESGRDTTPGRPILFVTTNKFLEHFGLTCLGDLPALNDNLEELKREAQTEIGGEI
ncbi:segregation and condensation protein B [Clostridia bacterium]|nr:segregation and condensation protein B [Clostridia bacterium]